MSATPKLAATTPVAVTVPTTCFLWSQAPISELKWLRRLQVRWTYWRCKWSAHHNLHFHGTIRDWDEACAAAERRANEDGRSWFVMELPEGAGFLLPKDTTAFGRYKQFPVAKADKRYHLRVLDTVPIKQAREVHQMARALRDLLRPSSP